MGFTGGGAANSGFVFISLKPLAQRDASADQVIARLRRNLSQVPGASLFLQAVQDFRIGGRQSSAQYQYTLQGDSLDDLYQWGPKILQAMQALPELRDVNSDQQNKGLESDLVIDRDTASRLGIKASMIDDTLYDAFGQRQVSTIYNPLNQYHVVMEVAPQYWQSPETLKDIYISTAGGAVGGVQSTNAVAGTVTSAKVASSSAAVASDEARNAATNSIALTGHTSASTGSAVSPRTETMIPLAAIAHFAPGSTALNVNHQGLFVATTLSFNLAPGVSLSDAVAAIGQAMNRIGVPASIRGSFQGTAQIFQQSLATEPYLVAAALAAVYIVLGVLYESYVHPITILSTLPSAGVGAVLALMATKTDFTLIALIGVILLIGIVKKNAIMMIDFALDAERGRGLASRQAIYEACLLRFRPIMMTTMAAMLGRGAARLRVRRGRRAAPSVGPLHRRRPHRKPDADALYDAGGLSLSRPLPPLGAAPLARHEAGSFSGRGGRRMKALFLAAALGALAGCTVGPDYGRPARAGARRLQGDRRLEAGDARRAAKRGAVVVDL